MSTYYTDPHQNPYWQNINGNSNQNDYNSQQASKDPNWHPEPALGRQLGKIAAVLGVLALFSIFLLPIIAPLILGSIAVVLAVISKGKEKEYTKGARRALVTGIIAIVMNVVLLVSSLLGLYLIMTNSQIRAQANSLAEQVYGYSFDDMIQQIMENYGIDMQSGSMVITGGDDDSDSSSSQSSGSGSHNNSNGNSNGSYDGRPSRRYGAPSGGFGGQSGDSAAGSIL